MESTVSNHGLSVSHLNPTVDSVAACSSTAGQQRPGQHSAAACSGEIRQSPAYTTGILSQTRGDRLQEIFWRVATRGPECDFRRLLLHSLRWRGRDADRDFRQILLLPRGKRKKTSCLLHAEVLCVYSTGGKPPE